MASRREPRPLSRLWRGRPLDADAAWPVDADRSGRPIALRDLPGWRSLPPAEERLSLVIRDGILFVIFCALFIALTAVASPGQ